MSPKFQSAISQKTKIWTNGGQTTEDGRPRDDSCFAVQYHKQSYKYRQHSKINNFEKKML